MLMLMILITKWIIILIIWCVVPQGALMVIRLFKIMENVGIVMERIFLIVFNSTFFFIM
jgi:hypothetical protein